MRSKFLEYILESYGFTKIKSREQIKEETIEHAFKLIAELMDKRYNKKQYLTPEEMDDLLFDYYELYKENKLHLLDDDIKHLTEYLLYNYFSNFRQSHPHVEYYKKLHINKLKTGLVE